LKRNVRLEEYLSGCQKSKSFSGGSFSGLVIQSFHRRIDFLLCDGGEVPVFREVLPDESVGVFIRASVTQTFDEAIRMLALR